MASVTVRSYRKEREKEIIDGLQKSMERVGALVERQAKLNVTKTGSEHPQVQTGRLRSLIIHETDNLSTTVGTNVEHGKHLELGFIHNRSGEKVGPYPWLFPAVEAKRSEIIETLKGKVTIEGV